MNCPRPFRRLAIAVIPAALSLALSPCWPRRRLRHLPARRRRQPPPRRRTDPAGNGSAGHANPPPAEVQTPANPTAEAPKPPATAPVQTADPFGEEIR